MAIGTGPVRLGADLAVEIYGSLGTNRSLGAIASTVGDTAPYNLHSQFEDWELVTQSWGSVDDRSGGTLTELVRVLNHDISGSRVVTLNFSYTIISYAYNTGGPPYMSATIDTSTAGSGWVNRAIATASSAPTPTTITSSAAGSFSITGIVAGQDIEIRSMFDWTGTNTGGSYMNIVLTGGTVTTGKGYVTFNTSADDWLVNDDGSYSTT